MYLVAQLDLYFIFVHVRFVFAIVVRMAYSRQLPQHFPVHLIRDIVFQIRQAYEDNHEYHDLSLGHGPASYGMHVHDTVCHLLKELEEHHGVETPSKSGSVEIHYGVFVMRPYKLGNSEEDDVWTSRPHNIDSSALRQMADRNAMPPLPGLGPEIPEEEPSDFVVGHFGGYDEEHSEGCRAIYLCVPWYVDDQFVGWRNCIQIYNAAEEEDLEAAGDILPPMEMTEEPEVTISEEAEVEFSEEPEIEAADEDEDESSKEEG